MNETKQRAYLSHPAFGRLPARRVLDCIFALTPDGAILHHHLEQLDAADAGGELVYTLTARAPAAGRERCRVIPPLAREFAR